MVNLNSYYIIWPYVCYVMLVTICVIVWLYSWWYGSGGGSIVDDMCDVASGGDSIAGDICGGGSHIVGDISAGGYIVGWWNSLNNNINNHIIMADSLI